MADLACLSFAAAFFKLCKTAFLFFPLPENMNHIGQPDASAEGK